MNNKIIVVNGRARAGKDTVIEYLREAFHARGVPTAATSSIDPVRDALEKWGFPVHRKTPADRDLLAEVGDSVEKYNGYRTNYCADFANNFLMENGTPCVIFIHMREPAMIDRLEQRARHTFGFETVRIKVTGNREIIVNSNAADANVDLMRSDYTIENNGTLESLKQACHMTATLIYRGVPGYDPEETS